MLLSMVGMRMPEVGRVAGNEAKAWSGDKPLRAVCVNPKCLIFILKHTRAHSRILKAGMLTRSDLSFRNVTLATVWRVGMGRTGCGEDSIEATPTRKGSKAVTM